MYISNITALLPPASDPPVSEKPKLGCIRLDSPAKSRTTPMKVKVFLLIDLMLTC